MKTKQQEGVVNQIIEIICNYADVDINDKMYLDSNAFKFCAVELSKLFKWNNIEDCLPENNTSVLTKNQFGFYGINHYEDEEWRMCTVEKIAGLLNLKEYTLDKLSKPTHWKQII